MPWYRTIFPERELSILATRSRLNDDQLEAQSPFKSKDSKGALPKNFTDLSSFQYFAHSTKQDVFSPLSPIIPTETLIGIIILPRIQEPRKVIWRTDDYCAVSDDIFSKSYPSQAQFDAERKKYNFEHFNEHRVRDNVVERFKEMSAMYKKERFKDPVINWTEGLFRYKIEEIGGIVVDLNNPESCKKGCVFNKIVQKITKQANLLSFYKLDKNNYPEKLTTDKTNNILKNFDESLLKKYSEIYRTSIEKP